MHACKLAGTPACMLAGMHARWPPGLHACAQAGWSPGLLEATLSGPFPTGSLSCMNECIPSRSRSCDLRDLGFVNPEGPLTAAASNLHAVRPGKPSTPLLPPPLLPALARSGSGPGNRPVSREPRTVTLRCRPCLWGRSGAGARASMRAILLAGPQARQRACMRAFMHESTADGRKACRVGLPPPFVEGLADNGADVRLVLDQQELVGAVLGGHKGGAN